MKKTTLITTLLILLFSACKKSDKKDVNCEDAILELCNPTTDQIVVYGLSKNYVTDTLFPGECDQISMGSLVIKYDDNGDLTMQEGGGPVYYYTGNGNYNIGIEECFTSMKAPSGYINIAHCYNGKFDPKEGELDVDCGGNCRPCKSFDIPCDSNLENGFKWDFQSQYKNLSSTYFGDGLNNKGVIRFTFYDGEELNVAIPYTEIPNKSQHFIVGSEYYLAEAWYSDRYGNNKRWAEDGSSIYLEVDKKGNKMIKFCEVEFKLTNGNSYRASAKLKVDWN